MLPESINLLDLISQLNAVGWRDYKIEDLCGLPKGYINDLRRKKVMNPRYQVVARIYNFHAQEFHVKLGNNRNEVIARTQSLAVVSP